MPWFSSSSHLLTCRMSLLLLNWFCDHFTANYISLWKTKQLDASPCRTESGRREKSCGSRGHVARWRLNWWRHRKSEWTQRLQQQGWRRGCEWRRRRRRWRQWVIDELWERQRCRLDPVREQVHRPSSGFRPHRCRRHLFQRLLAVLLDAAADNVAMIRTKFRWRGHRTTNTADRLCRPITLTFNSSFKVVLTPTQFFRCVVAGEFPSMMSTNNRNAQFNQSINQNEFL